jgi:glucokinase
LNHTTPSTASGIAPTNFSIFQYWGILTGLTVELRCSSLTFFHIFDQSAKRITISSRESGMQVSDAHFIGVDVGGTKVAAGLVNSAGEISHQTRTPMVATDAAAGLAAVISAIDSVRAAIDLDPKLKGRVSGIGICAPGPLDPKTGVVVNPPNLPGWRNFPLAAEVSKAYCLPVRVDNDGNAAALAEAVWGAGRGYRNVFCTTIGTGIGTGIVFDGHIYHGRTGAAGEGGHMSIDYRGPRCGCGKLGCIEALASGPAIARRAGEKIAAGRHSSIAMDVEVSGEGITGEMVGQAYAAGDLLAKEVLQETAMFLAVWLGNIVDLLDPDVIIIGGGAAPMLQPFLKEIRNQLPTWCVNSHCQEIPLVTAHYGPDAGIAGGAALCREASHDNSEPRLGVPDGIRQDGG